MRTFVARLASDELNRVIEYAMFGGAPARSVCWHTLQHVVNHATYHRGQVTAMLRQLGAEPPRNQDLITFYRKRA